MYRYAIVTRPVRQSRLKLALEEVMSSQSDSAQFAAQQQPTEQPPSYSSDSSAHNAIDTLSQQIQMVGDDGANQPGQQQIPQHPPLHRPSSQQPTGRQSDGAAREGQSAGSELEPKLSFQSSMSSMQSGSPSAVHAEHDAWQHRRNSLQRAPKVPSVSHKRCSSFMNFDIFPVALSRL